MKMVEMSQSLVLDPCGLMNDVEEENITFESYRRRSCSHTTSLGPNCKALLLQNVVTSKRSFIRICLHLGVPITGCTNLMMNFATKKYGKTTIDVTQLLLESNLFWV